MDQVITFHSDYLLLQVPGNVLISSTANPPLLARPFNMITNGDLASTVNWAGVQVGCDESYPSAVIFHNKVTIWPAELPGSALNT